MQFDDLIGGGQLPNFQPPSARRSSCPFAPLCVAARGSCASPSPPPRSDPVVLLLADDQLATDDADAD